MLVRRHYISIPRKKVTTQYTVSIISMMVYKLLSLLYVEEVDSSLIDFEINVVDSDLDDDVPNFNAVKPTHDIVDANTITTLFDTRFVSAPTKVIIKLMKIMRDHSIPLVAERELYKCAIEVETLLLSGFAWSVGSIS